MQRLTPALAMPGEAIIKEGEANLGLFFLMRGAVAVERRGRHVATMLATAAFGEQALLGGARPWLQLLLRITMDILTYYGCTRYRHCWAVQSRRRLSWRCASVRSRYCSGTTH